MLMLGFIITKLRQGENSLRSPAFVGPNFIVKGHLFSVLQAAALGSLLYIPAYPEGPCQTQAIVLISLRFDREETEGAVLVSK